MKETKVWRRAYQEKKYERLVQSQVKERSGMDGWEVIVCCDDGI